MKTKDFLPMNAYVNMDNNQLIPAQQVLLEALNSENPPLSNESRECSCGRSRAYS
jgi:hypothetical protein